MRINQVQNFKDLLLEVIRHGGFKLLSGYLNFLHDSLWLKFFRYLDFLSLVLDPDVVNELIVDLQHVVGQVKLERVRVVFGLDDLVDANLMPLDDSFIVVENVFCRLKVCGVLQVSRGLS